MMRIQTEVIALIISSLFVLSFGQTVKSCACENCNGLEKEDEFYSLTSSISGARIRRALKGTKRTLAVPVENSSFSITIKGSVLGSDFNMYKLCMWTKNVLILEPGYESAYSPDVISIDDEGNVGMHGVGTSLFAELGIPIENTREWTKSCVSTNGMISMVRIWLTAAAPDARMMIKALSMHACPRQKGLPPPQCENQQTLGNGKSYFQLSASHTGANRVLNGTKKAVRGPPGQTLSFTIFPPEGDAGFVISSLCIDTQKADGVLFTYQEIPAENSELANPVLSASRKPVITEGLWTETCADFQPLMQSRVTLSISSSNGAKRVMAKGLTMIGCPWTKPVLTGQVPRVEQNNPES